MLIGKAVFDAEDLEELVFLMYLDGLRDSVFNPKKISDDLNIDKSQVLNYISSLSDKNLITIEQYNSKDNKNPILNMKITPINPNRNNNYTFYMDLLQYLLSYQMVKNLLIFYMNHLYLDLE